MPRTLTKDRDQTRMDPDAAEGLAPLTEAEIQDQTDSGSFSRGRSYYRSKHIFDTVRRGATIRAQCHGSSGGPYLVEATLATADDADGDNPVDFGCDCPRGGFCKHVVALLLTWIHEPERFDVRPPLADLLAAKSREELAALVELMTRRYPDLEALIELPVPVPGAPPAAAVDEVTIRRQVQVAFRDDDGYDRRGRYDYDDYHAPERNAGKLDRIVELGNRYAEAGQYGSALVVYATVAEQTLPQLETMQDEEGSLIGVVIACDEGLSRCLDAQPGLPAAERLGPAERGRLIKTLYDIWLGDVAIGGVGMSSEGPAAIARNATDDEQARVAGWLRDLLDRPNAGDEWSRDWTKRAAIGFLSMLKPGVGLSEEELLAEYRNAELWEEAATTLLRLDRVEEAIALAARRLTAAPVLTRFADRLVASGDEGRVRQAIALIDSRLWEREGRSAHEDQTYMAWLEQQYAAHGMPEKALEMARRRFKAAPSKSTYDAVKAAALLPGQPDAPWSTLRPDLLATLRKRGEWGALIEIHLEDGEVAEAIAALKKTERPARGTSYGWGWVDVSEGYEARVAAAAERDFPDEAIRLYRQLADRMIEARQRTYYRQAAQYLARVKHVLEATGRDEEWRALIADLRQTRKSLRALREELDALGLA